MPTTFANTINGNEILAKRADCDYAGNDIQTTYATKSEVTTGLSAKEDASNKAQSVSVNSQTDYPSSYAVANYVNSSVSTNTAKFLGNFTLADLSLTYPATDAQIETALDGYAFSPAPTNNDYVYVEIQDPSTPGVADIVKRFKYDGANWLYEYSLNNSSFTAAEIAAIDSGVNATKVGNYDTHIADTTIHVTSTDKTTWNGKQDAISDLATIRSGAALGATAVQPGDLATVATSGLYSDLSGTPTIPTATSDLQNDSGFITLSDVPAQVNADWNSSSGASEILNKPSIPTATSDLQNDSGFITLSDVPAQVNADWNAVSGAAEILNKPTIPSGSDLVPPYSIPADEGKVLTIGPSTTYWATPTVGTVTDVEVDGTSVVSGGVASITMPTVDQTYNSASTNAQSGVAIAGELATINQVPASTSADSGKVLTVDSSGIPGWVAGGSGSTGLFEAVYGQTTYADVVQAIADKKIVYCRVSPSGASRMAFLAYVGSSNVEFQYYRSLSSHTASNQTDEVYVYTVSSSGWTTTTRLAGIKYIAGTNMSQSYNSSNSTLTFSATMPTVDQTYDGTSTNAQSGVAVAEAIADVNQLPAATSSDEGKVLTIDSNGDPEWATGGGGGTQADWSEADPTAPSYIENKPVPKTLVAGTGITITETANDLTVAATAASYTAGTGISISAQNVITNTGVAINKTTPELCGSFMGEPVYTKLYEFTGTVGTSDTTVNFTIDEVVATGSTVTRIWLDPSNSFIEYGSASVKLPMTYFLSSARHGSVFVVSQSTGTLSFRGVDTSSVGLTFFLAVKYTDSTP